MLWKGKTSSMRQSRGWKCLVDARGQRRMGWLIQADRRANLTEITTRYNRGIQQSICEATTGTNLRWMGYNSRRPHRVPLISTTNRKKKLQFARDHQNWTIEDWKNVAWSDESNFCWDIQMVESEFGINRMRMLPPWTITTTISSFL